MKLFAQQLTVVVVKSTSTETVNAKRKTQHAKRKRQRNLSNCLLFTTYRTVRNVYGFNAVPMHGSFPRPRYPGYRLSFCWVHLLLCDRTSTSSNESHSFNSSYNCNFTFLGLQLMQEDEAFATTSSPVRASSSQSRSLRSQLYWCVQM